MLCTIFQSTTAFWVGKEVADEINVKIVPSDSFESFVSNFGANFNSFLVTILKKSDFDNEPFYIKNLYFLFEQTDLVMKRTENVGSFIATHSKDIFNKYFSSIDLDIWTHVFTEEVKEKITQIFTKLYYIENRVCEGNYRCFIKYLISMPSFKHRTTIHNDPVNCYKKIIESNNMVRIASMLVEVSFDQYVKFVSNPTYAQLVIAIDEYFTNVDYVLKSQKAVLDAIIYDFNELNKNVFSTFFNIEYLNAIDEHLTKILNKNIGKKSSVDDDDYIFA
jgi:hypothetical protein